MRAPNGRVRLGRRHVFAAQGEEAHLEVSARTGEDAPPRSSIASGDDQRAVGMSRQPPRDAGRDGFMRRPSSSSLRQALQQRMQRVVQVDQAEQMVQRAFADLEAGVR